MIEDSVHETMAAQAAGMAVVDFRGAAIAAPATLSPYSKPVVCAYLPG
jgi:beta-phosphoglucomutase-like phosphatase (HAD superfamily)